MAIYFVTTNIEKYLEMKELVPELQIKNFNLAEVQELNYELIVKDKLKRASKKFPGLDLIVEDTGLHLDCLNGFPGPFIKWFLKKHSFDQIYEIVHQLGNQNAKAKTVIGYLDSLGEKHLFYGELEGKIVPPQGEGFGWDCIFQPEGQDSTFAEISKEEKNKISHRGIAMRNLKEFLDK
ncbi:non-canonical purine NTP pyrophosphatase [Candidatus Pacearchaeota archaeon CG09_land_8_20_14_0_10_30_9]|nr:non-canonical purine NTP pyrophosphatase [Candidatus Pacearchaeota archaeon]PIO00777.1 MAG: non-canonical purine NTP pyrophosphatase [Candidatus Pacearchaeota archaeon CG09_land_8_20_14_0_10_30_9]PJA71054.1 MAG: non-canonical purine NTP pyrophosphatase [Candidatus Pacearchaeota archaeon CG_4_9_14_3_um_filter_30_11]